MTNNKLLSIIIPVYNSGKYLARTLNSLVLQSLFNDNLQIILVNDGSTDDSQQIINHYIKQYPSVIECIEKSNGGLSDARNYGLANVTGKYLAFLDSDDWVDTQLYQSCISVLESDHKYDFINFNYIEEWGSHQRYVNSQEKIGRSKYFMPIVMWNKVFRTEFWHKYKFRFFKGIHYEDVELMPQIIFYANCVGYLNNTSYFLHYECDNKNSITQAKRDTDSLVMVFNRLKQFMLDKSDIELRQFIATNLFYQLVLFGGNPKLSYQIYCANRDIFSASNIVSKAYFPLNLLQVLRIDFLLHPIIFLLYKLRLDGNNRWALFKFW